MDCQPPPIEKVAAGVNRPFWSVMIPTYNCAEYLRVALESVLAQDVGPGEMQIEVVDDCSTKDDPESIVRDIGKGRVTFSRKCKNAGAIENFNTCIRRSRGHLVHILHGDDYVLPGFYRHIQNIAEKRHDIALIASRSFVVDVENIIVSVTRRLESLESGGNTVDAFLYGTPIQTPGVVVRRVFYERHGGFVSALVHTADREIWARAIDLEGGLITREVLACYRVYMSNDSSRLARTAENVRDIMRLNRLFAERYPGFDQKQAMKSACNLALSQGEQFSQNGDSEAARANLRYWKISAPILLRLRRFAGKVADSVLGKT